MRYTAVTTLAALLIAVVAAAFSSVDARENVPGASSGTLPISSILRDESGDIGTFDGTISEMVATGHSQTRSFSGLLNGRAAINGATIRVTDQAVTSRVTIFSARSSASAGGVSGVEHGVGRLSPVGAGSNAFSMQTAADPGKCDVLYLNVESITLNLLGLEVQTSQIRVDINAIPGEENLLGNLVCPAGAPTGSPTAAAAGSTAMTIPAPSAEGTPDPAVTATSVVEDLVGTEESGAVSPTPTA